MIWKNKLDNYLIELKDLVSQDLKSYEYKIDLETQKKTVIELEGFQDKNEPLTDSLAKLLAPFIDLKYYFKS